MKSPGSPDQDIEPDQRSPLALKPPLHKLACVLIASVLISGCTLTQQQVDQITWEYTHSLNRVGLAGDLKTAAGSQQLVAFDEVGLDSPEINYRPGLSLRQGPATWTLDQIHGQSKSTSPFEVTAGSLTFPEGTYNFNTEVTSTRICQDLPLDLWPELRSPKIHWLAGLDFVDYSFVTQSLETPQTAIKLDDLVHVPFTGLLLQWRLSKSCNLKGIFTESLVSNSGGQPIEYRDIGVALEWAPAQEWRSQLTVSRKNLGFDRRVGGELLDLEFEVQCIELSVTFSF